MTRSLRLCLASAATAAAVLAGTAGTAFADGVVDPAPIGPNNYFVGLVNDATSPATIHMACFGPVFPGQTGHPLAGQTVKVLPVSAPTTATAGYTGTAANSVLVTLSPASSTTTAIILHDWAVGASIPTSAVLPCYGSGKVTFTPVPTSPTARPATVVVNFVGQP